MGKKINFGYLDIRRGYIYSRGLLFLQNVLGTTFFLPPMSIPESYPTICDTSILVMGLMLQ